MGSEDQPKRSIQSLASDDKAKPELSIREAILKATAAAEASQAKAPRSHQRPTDLNSFLPPPINPFERVREDKPQVYSLRLERIKQLPDEELMRYLTREQVPGDGVLDEGAKMAITMELMARQAKQFERPKWWADIYFWVAAAGVVVASIGVVFAAVAAWPVLFPTAPL